MEEVRELIHQVEELRWAEDAESDQEISRDLQRDLWRSLELQS